MDFTDRGTFSNHDPETGYTPYGAEIDAPSIDAGTGRGNHAVLSARSARERAWLVADPRRRATARLSSARRQHDCGVICGSGRARGDDRSHVDISIATRLHRAWRGSELSAIRPGEPWICCRHRMEESRCDRRRVASPILSGWRFFMTVRVHPARARAPSPRAMIRRRTRQVASARAVARVRDPIVPGRPAHRRS